MRKSCTFYLQVLSESILMTSYSYYIADTQNASTRKKRKACAGVDTGFSSHIKFNIAFRNF